MVGALIPKPASGLQVVHLVNNRVLPRFPEEAQDVFAFLKDYSFSCGSTSPYKVRYESKQVYIEIRHDEWDCEISISFGRIASDEEFSFTLFLRLVNPTLEKQLGERLACTPVQVRDHLKKLAGALKQEGRPIMDGEDALFERMRAVRWWHFQSEALKRPPKKN
jgi:hypothetical protein